MSNGRPILGQECIVGNTMGRVISFNDSFPSVVGSYVEVRTFDNGIQAKYVPGNVELINPRGK